MEINKYPYLEQGLRIKTIRKELRLSQKTMAKDLKIQPGTLSDIERGRRNISRNIENKLVSSYNISPQYLREGVLPIFKTDSNQPIKTFMIEESVRPYNTEYQNSKVKELENEIQKLRVELLEAKDEIIRLLKENNSIKS